MLQTEITSVFLLWLHQCLLIVCPCIACISVHAVPCTRGEKKSLCTCTHDACASYRSTPANANATSTYFRTRGGHVMPATAVRVRRSGSSSKSSIDSPQRLSDRTWWPAVVWAELTSIVVLMDHYFIGLRILLVHHTTILEGIKRFREGAE